MYKEYLTKFWYSAKALENSKASFSIPTGGIFGNVCVNTFRNAIGAHYLPHSSEYVAPPSINVVRQWFLMIGYGEEKDIIINLKKKQSEKVVPYTRFHSLLIMHKMKEGYGDDEVTLYLTQVFNKPVPFKAPKPSSNVERVPQDTKPGAKPGHKKYSSSKQPSMSSKEATKGGSSKVPTGSKTSHSKKRKESSSTMDSNPSQPPVSTPVDPEMHKEDQQANGGPTSLVVTSEARANPQLGSGMSAFNLNNPIYSIFFIIHSEFASGNDALATFTAEANLGNYAPSDFVPQQQGMNEGTKNTSYDHLIAGTNPHVLTKQTKSVSEGLETFLTQPITRKEASSVASQIKEETSSTIKLKDLVKLVLHVQPSFKDMDLPEVDHVIVVNDSDEVEDDEVHATQNFETKDTSVPKSSSPMSSQLKELLVKSLKTEFSNILSAHDFSSSLPTELKDLPSKFNDLTEEWELPAEFLVVPSQVEMIQAKLKTLDALLSLLNKVTDALMLETRKVSVTSKL
ncbi:hypothetical protein Tco_0704924 [Tanacetum coccineum]|uniref:Uncharacterized protein n=1 Tax=Tanacetum coccineum TaxID=301880 RepID=A0ABQ4Y4Q6_9ASTR